MSLPFSNIRSLAIWLVIMLAIVLYLALFPLEWVPEENWLRILMGVILLFLVYRFRDTLFDTADRLASREKKERESAQ
jgi:cobalamin synthase